MSSSGERCPEDEGLERWLETGCQPKFDRHLAGCRRCRERVETLRHDRALVTELHAAFEALRPRPARLPAAPRGYRFVRELHRGGQGAVYEALQESTRRIVALKMPLHCLVGERERERFEREVEAIAKLQHPNLVVVHDSGTTDEGRPWYAMELVDGCDLEVWLRTGPLLDERFAVFGKVASAVAATHRRGVVHRDLKPSNVLVDRTGEPRVVDFGLAKVEFDVASLTRSGEFLGSLTWCAPEQVAGKEVDARTDVHGLGALLYTMVADRPPFSGHVSLRELVRVVSHEMPPPPSMVGSRKLGGDLDLIVAKALAKDPRERYASAEALAADVERYRAGHTIEARRSSLGYVINRSVKRHPAWSTMLAATILALLTGGLTLRSRAARIERHWIADELSAARLHAGRGNLYETERRAWPHVLSDVPGDTSVTLGAPIDTRAFWILWGSYLAHPSDARAAVVANCGIEGRPLHEQFLVHFPDSSRVELWDASTFQVIEQHDFGFPSTSPYHFDPSGTTLVTAPRAGGMFQVSLEAGSRVGLLPSDRVVVMCAFSPNGRLLAALDTAGTVHLVDVATRRATGSLECFGLQARGSLCFLDDDHVVALSNELELVLISVAEQRELWRGRSMHAWRALPAPGRSLLAVSCDLIELWERRGDELGSLGTLPAYLAGDNGMAFDARAEQLAASGRREGSFEIWSLDDWSLARSHYGHVELIRDMVTIEDRWLVTLDEGGVLRRWAWDVPGRSVVPIGDGRSTIHDLEFVGAEDELLLGCSGVLSGVVRAQGKTLDREPSERLVSAVVALADGGWIASTYDGSVLVSGALAERWRAAKRDCKANYLAADRKEERFAVAYEDGLVRVLDRSGAILAEADAGSRLSSVAWTADDTLVAAGSKSGLLLWLPLDGRPGFRSEPGHVQNVRCLAAPSGGAWIASGDDEGGIALWRLGAAAPARILEGHSAAVYALAFHPEGRLLASGDRRGRVRLWDLASGDLLTEFQALGDSIFALEFHADGRRLAVGGEGPALHVWDLLAPVETLRANVLNQRERWQASGTAEERERLARWAAGGSPGNSRK